jgi:hypothetical protein
MLGSASTTAGSLLKFICKRDVLAQQPPEHFGHAATTRFRSSGRGLTICLRPKASSWRVRPAARSEACLIWARGGQRLRVQRRQGQQRGMAEDDREDVVEIMRHAAGQLADGLHFLRLAQLLLQPFMAR